MQTIEGLIEIIENYVEADEIKSEDSFKLDLGMSSFDTMCMVAEIESVMGVKLTAADFIKHKTVGEMAAYISAIR
ncbi:MAG: acyl carrier protein [Ruminococcaceae bacterium]|nr:acyl carrier protein [Oscillospiraceae bacterium]MBQ9913523.1 acyl carrier protein [Clostridia bacterium]